MEDDAPVIYGLEFQARALTAQTAETDAIRFLVGTQSLRYDNQIHVIDFDDENNIINKNVLLHHVGEIWQICASPADKNVLATCYNKRLYERIEYPLHNDEETLGVDKRRDGPSECGRSFVTDEVNFANSLKEYLTSVFMRQAGFNIPLTRINYSVEEGEMPKGL